jgi:prophage regulatory protein
METAALQTATDSRSPPRLERLPDVIARTGLSRTTIQRLIAAGTFAQPVRLTGRKIAFVAAEVDAWIAARVTARDHGPEK